MILFDGHYTASGSPIFQRERLLSRHNIGAGYAQDWAIEEAVGNSVSASVLDSLGIFKLPIGVKPSEELKEDRSITFNRAEKEDILDAEMKPQPQVSPIVPWDALTDASYEAVTDLYSNASAILKGNNADVSKKQGNLSARAASMLVPIVNFVHYYILFSIYFVHFYYIFYLFVQLLLKFLFFVLILNGVKFFMDLFALYILQ